MFHDQSGTQGELDLNNRKEIMTQNSWLRIYESYNDYFKRNHSSAILLGGPCVVTAAPTRNEAPDHLGQFSF